MELCSSIGRAVCDIVEALRGIRLTCSLLVKYVYA